MLNFIQRFFYINLVNYLCFSTVSGNLELFTQILLESFNYSLKTCCNSTALIKCLLYSGWKLVGLIFSGFFCFVFLYTINVFDIIPAK